ncbi:MAG: ABC transporter substrate-binding protein [Hyphomicrobiaceae bacterium]
MDRRTLLGGGLAFAAGALPLFYSIPAIAGPKRGGHVRLGIGDGHTTDSLDPTTTENSYMDILNHSVRSYLAEIGPDGKAVPELAESWEATNGARKWAFRLRKGVEFHNGKTLTADDVVGSIEAHRSADSKSGGRPLLAGIQKLYADGKDLVVFELNDGNADFPYILTDYHFVIVPVADGHLDTSGVGSGAYVLEQFVPGISAKLKRHPNFFRSDRGWFDSGELLAIRDPAARSNALAAGEIDIMHDLPPKLASLVQQNGDLVVESVPGSAHCTLPMRSGSEPFGNNDVRLALKYAIDRKAIVKTILYGQGTIGNDHPVSPGMPYWADLPQREHDPERARHHLKKAGLSSLSIELQTAEAAFAGATDTSLLFQEQAKASGIEIKVKRVADDGYWSNTWNKAPFCIALWAARPTPDMILSTAYASGVAWNESEFSNATFDKLLVAARSELDETKRANMYREMQMILSDEGNTLVPFFANHVFARSRKIDHGPVSSSAPIDGNRAMERWWYA